MSDKRQHHLAHARGILARRAKAEAMLNQAFYDASYSQAVIDGMNNYARGYGNKTKYLFRITNGYFALASLTTKEQITVRYRVHVQDPIDPTSKIYEIICTIDGIDSTSVFISSKQYEVSHYCRGLIDGLIKVDATRFSGVIFTDESDADVGWTYYR